MMNAGTFEEFVADLADDMTTPEELQELYAHHVRWVEEDNAKYAAWLAAAWYPDDSGEPIGAGEGYVTRVYTDAGDLVLSCGTCNSGDAMQAASMYRAKYRQKLYRVVTWDARTRTATSL